MNESGSLTPQICKQDIGDAELSYLLYEGEGPPLIFLHATGFLPWLWHPLARELASAYRIVAPSFCEHRETDPEDGGLSWVTLAEDTVRLCNALQLKKPFLVGHSMGATVHLIAHTLYGLEAAGMILIEPILLPAEFYRGRMSVDEHPFAAKAIRRTNFWHHRDEAMAYLRSRSLFQGWDEEMLELYIRYGMTGGKTADFSSPAVPSGKRPSSWGEGSTIPGPFFPKSPVPSFSSKERKAKRPASSI